MSGLPEKTSTAQQPPEDFAIPPTENPIKFGAQTIRDLSTVLVTTELNGVFPRNYVYQVGDYNLIFHSMRDYGEHGGGFSVSDDMIVLTPEGEYKSGNVKHDVQDWTNSWKFRDADLKPASDLEIVRYSPALLGELFHQLVDELGEQTEFESVTKVVASLGKRKDILEKVRTTSNASLREMGGNPDEQPQGEEEITREKKIIERENKLLRRANAALSLYRDSDQLVRSIQDVVQGGRAGKAEETLLAILQRGVEEGVLERNEFEDWENLGVRSYHGDRAWNMVIADGKIQEAYAYSGIQEPTRACPEHTLQMAPDIAQAIISRGVKKVFPKLELEY